GTQICLPVLHRHIRQSIGITGGIGRNGLVTITTPTRGGDRAAGAVVLFTGTVVPVIPEAVSGQDGKVLPARQLARTLFRAIGAILCRIGKILAGTPQGSVQGGATAICCPLHALIPTGPVVVGPCGAIGVIKKPVVVVHRNRLGLRRPVRPRRTSITP